MPKVDAGDFWADGRKRDGRESRGLAKAARHLNQASTRERGSGIVFTVECGLNLGCRGCGFYLGSSLFWGVESNLHDEDS